MLIGQEAIKPLSLYFWRHLSFTCAGLWLRMDVFWVSQHYMDCYIPTIQCELQPLEYYKELIVL